MRTGKYELIVIWETGEKDIYEYDNESVAEEKGNGMITALGKQISWYCVRPQIRV